MKRERGRERDCKPWKTDEKMTEHTSKHMRTVVAESRSTGSGDRCMVSDVYGTTYDCKSRQQ
jgi:hypothetical protein